MDTIVNQKRRPQLPRLPHPRKAREAAGYTTRGLRKAYGFGLGTISWCEKHGLYPRNPGTRALYLAALGLPPEPAKGART